MTARIVLLSNGRWVIDIEPQGDNEVEIGAIMNSSEKVWEVMVLGAMLRVGPTEEYKED